MTEKPTDPAELPAEMAVERNIIPVGNAATPFSIPDLRYVHFAETFRSAVNDWLMKSRSQDTRDNYARDLTQFCGFSGIRPDALEGLARVAPRDVAAWRDYLRKEGMENSTIRRKLTVVRSLFRYLQTSGYSGINPAHKDFVDAPSVPRDGTTVGLAPHQCRLLLDAPNPTLPIGIRDRAILAVLAYSACRVGELVKLTVGDYKSDRGHRILEITGKGDKKRRVPLHPEAFERLETWLNVCGQRTDPTGALFRPSLKPRAHAGFHPHAMTRRAVQLLVEKLVKRLGLDAAVTVHSFRVTALTTARERGCDIVDLQDFAGHGDPRTTLSYIRNRDQLNRSPAYVLVY